jgi:hypothetical protein
MVKHHSVRTLGLARALTTVTSVRLLIGSIEEREKWKIVFDLL